jgi:hypothetical protein
MRNAFAKCLNFVHLAGQFYQHWIHDRYTDTNRDKADVESRQQKSLDRRCLVNESLKWTGCIVMLVGSALLEMTTLSVVFVLTCVA